ncbi:MAG: formylglycine-generating enzyme family protein, partial [Bacteroidota bacterium]
TSCAREKIFNAELIQPPVATMQLGPSIFLSDSYFENIDAEEGTPVRVEINNKIHDLRIYRNFEELPKVGLHYKYRDYFGINYKDTIQIRIVKINNRDTELTPKPIKFIVENYSGDLNEWNNYAFGAPHGDCDNETGAIVKIVSEKYGIPSTAAYGCRLSYRGIWYDCNRPLMKEPKPSGKGVIGERHWNEKAMEKYSVFQDSAWSNSKLKYGKRFKLFTSFHGHDLTVKLPDGKKIQRPVIEGIGSGFTKNELRKIKKFYYRNRDSYYENPPDLYFGNLPEDLEYEYKGVKLNFFYSGLGTRTYGTLRSDMAEHILHFETPNSMRINPEIQPKTAKLLNDIYQFVKDSIFAQQKPLTLKAYNYSVPKDFNKKANLKGGEFLFGAPDGFGWNSERPQNKVTLSPFEIDIYEVTNKQYCEFLNKQFASNEIEVNEGEVFCKTNSNLLFKTKKAITFSEIDFDNNKFSVVSDREYFPVVFVTYYGAKKYAVSRGERLPTEAEWEYAASWDGKEKYLFGYKENESIEKYSNYEDSYDYFEREKVIKTTPVGYYKKSSPFGVKDMSGNVWEWCSDYYQYDIHKVYTGKKAANPKVTKKSTMNVIKGGAWNTEGSVTSTTKRLGINPNAALINLGFRCVKMSNNE